MTTKAFASAPLCTLSIKKPLTDARPAVAGGVPVCALAAVIANAGANATASIQDTSRRDELACFMGPRGGGAESLPSYEWEVAASTPQTRGELRPVTDSMAPAAPLSPPDPGVAHREGLPDGEVDLVTLGCRQGTDQRPAASVVRNGHDIQEARRKKLGVQQDARAVVGPH